VSGMSLLLCFITLLCSTPFASSSNTTYQAIVNQASQAYTSLKGNAFVGSLVINDTIDSSGELTISLCDIISSAFDGQTLFQVFNDAKTASIASIVSASATASLDINIDISGCLQFYFDPCCETVGLRFILNNPLVLSAQASFGVSLSSDIDSGSTSISFDPEVPITIPGFSGVIGSWKLPSILDNIAADLPLQDQYCATLPLPADLSPVKFCVVLGNFSASSYNIEVCPRLTVSYGSTLLLDLSYSNATSKAGCLHLGYVPQCTRGSTVVASNIVQLFKSTDLDNDYKLVLDEIQRSKALLGIFTTQAASVADFIQMDTNSDGVVDFPEFQQYTAAKAQTYATTPYADSKTSKIYTPGDVALAVIMTLLATSVVVAVVLVAVAQYKGIIKLEWLNRVIPSRV